MKNYITLILFLISIIAYTQEGEVVKTKNGKSVLLKADFTWEYVSTDSSKVVVAVTKKTVVKNNSCNLPVDFIEPQLDKKIQTQLKKGRATIVHVKRKVAKDFECNTEDVILLSAKESKANGIYNFCVKGKKVTYKRNGHSIAKKLKVF